MSTVKQNTITALEATQLSMRMLALTAIVITMQTDHDSYVALFDTILKAIGGPLGPILVQYIGGSAIFNIVSFATGLYTAQDGVHIAGLYTAQNTGDAEAHDGNLKTAVTMLAVSAKYVGMMSAATSIVLPILVYAKALLAH